MTPYQEMLEKIKLILREFALGATDREGDAYYPKDPKFIESFEPVKTFLLSHSLTRVQQRKERLLAKARISGNQSYNQAYNTALSEELSLAREEEAELKKLIGSV